MNFPCWRYHRDGRAALVHSAEQHERETPAGEWHPMPVAHYSNEEYAEITGAPAPNDPALSIEEAEAVAEFPDPEEARKAAIAQKRRELLAAARAKRKFGKE